MKKSLACFLTFIMLLGFCVAAPTVSAEVYSNVEQAFDVNFVNADFADKAEEADSGFNITDPVKNAAQPILLLNGGAAKVSAPGDLTDPNRPSGTIAKIFDTDGNLVSGINSVKPLSDVKDYYYRAGNTVIESLFYIASDSWSNTSTFYLQTYHTNSATSPAPTDNRIVFKINGDGKIYSYVPTGSETMVCDPSELGFSLFDKWVKVFLNFDYINDTYSVDLNVDGILYPCILGGVKFPVAAITEGGIDDVRLRFHNNTGAASMYMAYTKMRYEYNNQTSVKSVRVGGDNFDSLTLDVTTNAPTQTRGILFNRAGTWTSKTVSDPFDIRSGKVLELGKTDAIAGNLIHVETRYTGAYSDWLPVIKSGVTMYDADYYISSDWANSMTADNFVQSQLLNNTNAGNIDVMYCLRKADNKILLGQTVETEATYPYNEWFTMRVMIDYRQNAASPQKSVYIIRADGSWDKAGATVAIPDANIGAARYTVYGSFATEGDHKFYMDNDIVYNVKAADVPAAPIVNITGTPVIGQTLTAAVNGATGGKYQWYRGSSKAGYVTQTAISGATSATYTLTEADKNCFIKAEVTVLSGMPITGSSVPSPATFVGDPNYKYVEDFDRATGAFVYDTNTSGALTLPFSANVTAEKYLNVSVAAGNAYAANASVYYDPVICYGNANSGMIRAAVDYRLPEGGLADGFTLFSQLISGKADAAVNMSVLVPYAVFDTHIRSRFEDKNAEILADAPVGEWFTMETLIYINEGVYDVNLIRADGSITKIKNKELLSEIYANDLKVYGIRQSRSFVMARESGNAAFSCDIDNIRLERVSQNTRPTILVTPIAETPNSAVYANATLVSYGKTNVKATLLLAIYNSYGVLKEIKLSQTTIGNETYGLAEAQFENIALSDGDIIKAFFWNDETGSLKPYTESAKIINN